MTAAALDYPGGRPNPAQARADAILADAEEVMYGGALGGGKTDWLLAAVLRVMFSFPGSNGLIMRRTFPELEQLGGIIRRLQERIPKTVGTYSESKHIWKFSNSSALQLGHLNAGESDLGAYLGGEFSVIGIDQADEFQESWVDRLGSRLRVSGPLRQTMAAAGYTPRLLLTANPGGIGHAWLKRRFVDPFPKGNVIFRPPPTAEDPKPRTRAFVPALVFDNLENIGEEYLRVLNKMSAEDRRALRDGDWNVYKGQRFTAFQTAVHVIDPDELPLPPGSAVARGLGIDYGSTNPFVGIWGALIPLALVPGAAREPNDPGDMLVIYREVDAVGLTPREQARLLRSVEAPDERGQGRMLPTVLDPACWAGTPEAPSLSRRAHLKGSSARHLPPAGSIADSYWKAGLHVRKADNRRVEGATEIAERLRVRADGRPRILIYSTCPNLIRTLPLLQRDPKRVEDVQKSDQDHWYDATRYLAMLMRLNVTTVTPGSTPGSGRRSGRPLAGIPGAGTGGLRRAGF